MWTLEPSLPPPHFMYQVPRITLSLRPVPALTLAQITIHIMLARGLPVDNNTTKEHNIMTHSTI